MYCANCGTQCANCAGAAEEQTSVDREVEITRINRKADIEIARIQAGAAKTEAEAEVDIAEVEAAAGVEAAEAVADALTEIVAPPEPEPAPAIVVEPEPAPEPEPSPVDDIMPPPEKSEHKGYGNSAFFGGR